jgi:transcriptional regulator with XRE-family HTH domain
MDHGRVDWPERDAFLALIGSGLRRERHRLGWSQRKLAEVAGVDQSLISRLEKRHRAGHSIRAVHPAAVGARVASDSQGVGASRLVGAAAPPPALVRRLSHRAPASE